MFAAVFITVKSIEAQVANHAFSVQLLFTNKLFSTLIVSMCSTYVLYFVMSFLFFDPWHMFTSVSLFPLPQPRQNPINPNFHGPSSSNTSS